MVIIEVTRESSNVEGSECFHVLCCFSFVIYNKCFAGSFNIISDILRNKRVGLGTYPFFLILLIVLLEYLNIEKHAFCLTPFFNI